MKKITLTLLALICLLSAFSQHPQGLDSFMLQTLGSAKTLIKSKGAAGSDSGLVNSVYPDTASANFGKIKNYPGAMIRTGDSLWMRNYNATEWLLFSFGSSGAAYTVDNGLTASTPTNFQLGGTLIQNTQLHNDAYSLTIDQDAGSTVDPLQVFANNNNAIVGNSVDQTGVIGSSTNGYGVQANSSAVGIKATAPIAGQFQLPANDLVTEDPVIQLYRLASAAANGQGLSIQYLGSTSTGNVESLGSITAKWTDVTQATRTSMMEFYETNSAVTARKMAIAGDGQLILDNYGVGAFTGTRTYNLGVDVSGNVIEVDTTAIVSESDPIALAKTITLTAGAGISIAETATQALSLNPSWTITSNILTSQLTWSVLDILNTPPGSPADGDIYLVGTAGTGAWSGHNNEIATWDATGAVWTFETASTGDLLNNVDENTSGDNGVYKFNGSTWVLQTSVTTGAYWVIGGNSGYTNPKLGTIDNKGLRFIAHNKQWLTVASNKTITWNDFTGVGTGFLKVSAAGVMSRDNSVYITGNQTITLSGDVTGSGTTTISTTIASHAVSNAKFRQSAGLSIVGNSTNSTADVADITGTDGQVLRVSGTSLGFGSVLASSISSGANLSVTSGTNVILTISSGTGTGALLTAAGITAGWIGQLSVDKGGTGLAAVTAHYLLVGNSTSALTLLAPSATSGIPLISQGSSSDPAYGTTAVAGGGTGNTTFTAYSVITAGTTTTGAFQNVSGVGTSGQVLTSQGAGTLPIWANVSTSSIRLDQITAATSTATINSTSKLIEWQWNSIVGTDGFKISSSATTANFNVQTLLVDSLYGANATASQTTTAMAIYNKHTGTTSTNISLSLTASGGTNNVALATNSVGRVGIGTVAPSEMLQVVGGIIASNIGVGGASPGSTFPVNILIGSSGGTSTTGTASSNSTIYVGYSYAGGSSQTTTSSAAGLIGFKFAPVGSSISNLVTGVMGGLDVAPALAANNPITAIPLGFAVRNKVSHTGGGGTQIKFTEYDAFYDVGLNTAGLLDTLIATGGTYNGLKLDSFWTVGSFTAHHIFERQNGAGAFTNILNSKTAIGSVTEPTESLVVTGNILLATAGNKLKITTGSNASIGTATLSGGTVTVSTTAVTASSIIFLTDATTGALTNVGSPTVGTKTAGVSFVINSTNVLDASTVNWIIIN